MSITPLEIRKVQFARRLRGVDPSEVQDFLDMVADELGGAVERIEQLEKEIRYYKQRLQEAGERQRELQEALVRAQKVADEILATARREAEIVVREAENTADKIVTQAMEQASKMESRLGELRLMRQELRTGLQAVLDTFQRRLDEDREDHEGRATVHTLPRSRSPQSE